MKVWFMKFFALMITTLIITVESKQESSSFTVEPEPRASPPYSPRSNVTLRCQVSGSKPSSLKIVKYGSNTILVENNRQHSLEYQIRRLRCQHMGTYVCLQQSPDRSEIKYYVDVPVNGCKPRLCSEEDKKTDQRVQHLEDVTVFYFCIISNGDLNVSKIFFDKDHEKTVLKKDYMWNAFNQPQSSLNKDVAIRISKHVNKLENSRNITFRFKRKGEASFHKKLDYTTDLPQRWKLAALKDTTAPVSMTSKRDDENRTLTSPTVSETDHENETTAQTTSRTDDKNMTTIAPNTSKTDYENMTTTALTESIIDDENTTSAPMEGLDMSKTTPTVTLTATEIPTTKATTTASTTTNTTITPSPTTTTTTSSPTTTTTTTTPSPTTPSPTTTTTTTTLSPTTTTSWPSSSRSSSSDTAETTTTLQRLRQNDNDNESLPYIILGVVLAAVLSISCMLGILVFRYRKLLFSERVRQALAGEQHSPSQDDDYDEEEEAIYQNADAIRDSLNMNKGRYVSDQGLIYVTVDHEPRKKKPKTKREKNVIYASLDFDKSGKKTVQELAKHHKSGKHSAQESAKHDKSGKHSAQESAKRDKSGKHSAQESAKRDKSGKHSAQESAKRDKSGKHSAQESAKSNKKHRHKHETSKHSQEARPFIHSNDRHEDKRMQRDNGGETPRAHRVHQDHRDNFDERGRKDQKRNIGQSLQIVNEWFENRRPVEHIYANT